LANQAGAQKAAEEGEVSCWAVLQGLQWRQHAQEVLLATAMEMLATVLHD
jgi:hypothetical protein